jgi:hypothetical protein
MRGRGRQLAGGGLVNTIMEWSNGGALAVLGGGDGLHNFSSGDVTNSVRNRGFFERPFTKPSLQILVLPLKPRSIERPEDRDEACSISNSQQFSLSCLRRPCALGPWRIYGDLRVETP